MRVVRGMTEFKNKEEIWPEKTNVWCWHCCHSFETPPCFVPTLWDTKRDRLKYFGVFCSWSCAKTYNSDMRDCKSGFRSQLMTSIVRTLGGKTIHINPAPPKQALKVFGGYLTISEFRKKHLYCKYRFDQLNTSNFYTEFTEISNLTKKKNKEQTKLRLSRPDIS